MVREADDNRGMHGPCFLQRGLSASAEAGDGSGCAAVGAVGDRGGGAMGWVQVLRVAKGGPLYVVASSDEKCKTTLNLPNTDARSSRDRRRADDDHGLATRVYLQKCSKASLRAPKREARSGRTAQLLMSGLSVKELRAALKK